uniref:Putative ovule protein n=1 Tax=Solanum chacoense TaxID=4108 RepID=A0A0V0IEE0_SOLCH
MRQLQGGFFCRKRGKAVKRGCSEKGKGNSFFDNRKREFLESSTSRISGKVVICLIVGYVLYNLSSFMS